MRPAMYVFVFRDETGKNFGQPRSAIPWPRGRLPGRYARIPRSLTKKAIARYRKQVRRCYVMAMGASDRYDLCARGVAMIWRGKLLPCSALPFAELVVPFAIERGEAGE